MGDRAAGGVIVIMSVIVLVLYSLDCGQIVPREGFEVARRPWGMQHSDCLLIGA